MAGVGLLKLFALLVCAGVSTAAGSAETEPTANGPLLVATDAVRNLGLPLNRVYLYRETAQTMRGRQDAEATTLLVRALDDLDIAEQAGRASATLDEKTLARMEFARRPVLLLMVSTDPAQAMLKLRPPQSADSDTEFQRLIFEALSRQGTAQVSEAAAAKLTNGATPAVVAAYAVLLPRDPAAARVLAASLVNRLTQTDPAKDPMATQAALALLRLVRSDEGTRAPRMIVDEQKLDHGSAVQLFKYLGAALLVSKETELLILPETPQLYVKALAEYAPEESQAVALLPFAAPGAKSILLTPEATAPTSAAPDAVVSEAVARRREAAQAQMLAELTATSDRLTQLRDAVDALTDKKSREKALTSAVQQANEAISMGRTLNPLLQPGSFEGGELVLYDAGPVNGVVRGISALVRHYGETDPEGARRAVASLDGSDVQIVVRLQLELSLMARAR